MTLDETLLAAAREAADRLAEAQRQADVAKAYYHRAIRRLHLGGASLREIAEALDLSHQRVHQIVEAAGGTPDWRHRKASDLACAFCGAAKGEVGRLVAGPGLLICDGCVTVAKEVVAATAPVERAATRLDPVAGTSTLTCSFCGKSARDARALVAGPGVRICDGCVDYCLEVITITAP